MWSSSSTLDWFSKIISLLIMKSTNDKVPQYIKALFTLYPNGTIDLDYLFHGWIYTNPIVYLLVPLCLGTLCLLILGVPWGHQYRWTILKENSVIISLVKYNYFTFETMDYRTWHLSCIERTIHILVLLEVIAYKVISFFFIWIE